MDGKPVEVAIGFYALDFARVTSRDESFDLTGYLEMSWHDPGLARSSRGHPGPAGRPSNTKTTWTPRVFFENAPGTAPVPRRAGRRGRRDGHGDELGDRQRQVLGPDGPEALPVRPPGHARADRGERGRRRSSEFAVKPELVKVGDGGVRHRLDDRPALVPGGHAAIRPGRGEVLAVRATRWSSRGGRPSTSGG